MTAGRTRIVYVAASAELAGPAGDLLLLLPRLEPGRFAPVLVVPDEPGPAALEIQHAGAMVHALGVPAPLVARGLAGSTLAVHRLARLFRDFRPDVAHALDEASSLLVALAGRAAGVPVLIGTWREHGRRAPAFGSRVAIRKLDRLVAPTDALRAEASALLRGKHPPIEVIAPGVDAALVRGFARAPELSEPKPRAGTIARIADGQGIEDLIGAAARLGARMPDFEWLVLGQGPEALAHLRRLQRDGLADTVRLLGDRDDLGRVLAALDVYVSAGGGEAVPAGLLKALAAGLPCVAVSNPSLQGAFRGPGDVVLVPREGGAPALEEAVARVLADGAAELRRRLRAAGSRVAPAHDAGAHASAVQALYVSEMAEARRRSG